MMLNRTHFSRLENPDSAIQTAAELVDGAFLLRREACEERGWVVLPIEGGTPFGLRASEQVARAMAGCNSPHCFAVLTDVPDPREYAFRLEAKRDSIASFSREYWVHNILFESRDGSGVVLATKEEFSLLAGSTAFVETAAGMTVDTGRKVFREEFAVIEQWEPETRDFFVSVAERYDTSGLL